PEPGADDRDVGAKLVREFPGRQHDALGEQASGRAREQEGEEAGRSHGSDLFPPSRLPVPPCYGASRSVSGVAEPSPAGCADGGSSTIGSTSSTRLTRCTFSSARMSFGTSSRSFSLRLGTR